MRGIENQSREIRVLIVDDTRTVRSLIRNALATSSKIKVVGEAQNAMEARELIPKLRPDVLTLDVIMPKVDGITFLDELMSTQPMPVIMVSSRTSENSRDAIRALSLGAIDCVDLSKMRSGEASVDLAEMVMVAANSNVKQARPITTDRQPSGSDFRWNKKTVLIGSSTGGVDALLTVLGTYPEDGPPTVIAQHMPASFLESFANRIDKNCRPKTVLAQNGMRMEQGHVYLAPGGDGHVVLSRHDASKINIISHDGTEPYVPSVNLLFASAEIYADRCIGVMLTGMGRDGADAMLRMRNAGAHTIVQDASSSVVDGMPKSARALGAAVEVATLLDIGPRILKNASRQRQDIKA